MSFLLEEALDGLKKVRELQDLRDDSARWSELPRQQQIARMNELEQHERQVCGLFRSADLFGVATANFVDSPYYASSFLINFLCVSNGRRF